MKDLSNENIIHIKNNNIQYLQFKRLLQYQNKLKHCYTLKPLDFKNSTKDSDDYKKICKEININNENIYLMKHYKKDVGPRNLKYRSFREQDKNPVNLTQQTKRYQKGSIALLK